MIDEGDDVDEDINGIQHLFDEWSDGENFNSIMITEFPNKHSFVGAVGMPQASPTRDSHRGSPMTMDDNKGGQTPGMSDNQSGQSRNMFAIQEAEEVRNCTIAACIDFFI